MAGPFDNRSFLVRTPFFGGLADPVLERIIGMLVERSFPEGAAVFRMGDQGRSMYIVQSGELVACTSGDSGRPVRLMRFHPGDFFGETTLIEMQPRPFTVLVEKPATLYELTNMDLYRLYQQDVNAYVIVLQNINRELCRRLRAASVRLTQIADSVGGDVTQIRSPGIPLGQLGSERMTGRVSGVFVRLASGRHRGESWPEHHAYVPSETVK